MGPSLVLPRLLSPAGTSRWQQVAPGERSGWLRPGMLGLGKEERSSGDSGQCGDSFPTRTWAAHESTRRAEFHTPGLMPRCPAGWGGFVELSTGKSRIFWAGDPHSPNIQHPSLLIYALRSGPGFYASSSKSSKLGVPTMPVITQRRSGRLFLQSQPVQCIQALLSCHRRSGLRVTVINLLRWDRVKIGDLQASPL